MLVIQTCFFLRRLSTIYVKQRTPSFSLGTIDHIFSDSDGGWRTQHRESWVAYPLRASKGGLLCSSPAPRKEQVAKLARWNADPGFLASPPDYQRLITDMLSHRIFRLIRTTYSTINY